MISRIDLARAGTPQALNQVERGETRHVPIDDDQMRRPLGYSGDGRSTVGDRADDEPGIGQFLPERFDCGNIPIDDEYLFIGIDGEHTSGAIIDAASYSSLTAFRSSRHRPGRDAARFAKLGALRTAARTETYA